ncbi:MAG: sigma 54-interacting transcriptional regulator [Treponemataceae bacterium]|nr:sigma 54-interacting transcriptional regulator [Treponemataceae bacterium]
MKTPHKKQDDDDISCFYPSQMPLLFTGESGTGKTHSASSVHCDYKESQAPFLPLNCAGISETLAESTLFGCTEGAYTGAKSQVGYFGRAANGTIFLDEVGELSLATQAKLLQVISEGIYMRLGSSVIRKSNARVICASNSDLKKKVAEGSFRADLYYRISAMPVHIKPLRERKSEIPKLALQYLRQINHSMDKNCLGFLITQPWPGNIRQLNHCLEVAAGLAKNNPISLDNLRQAYKAIE